MSSEAEQVARAILAELEERLASKDRDRILEQWTEDAVLIGDAAENFTRDETAAYLTGMAEMAPTVRWEWENVAVMLSSPQALVFAAVGAMGFYDAEGSLMGDTEHFRTTCLAIEEQGSWRLRHFHGSEPQDG
jgi:uncharacterized protein (TIGR02246 family)